MRSHALAGEHMGEHFWFTKEHSNNIGSHASAREHMGEHLWFTKEHSNNMGSHSSAREHMGEHLWFTKEHSVAILRLTTNIVIVIDGIM